MRVGKFKNGNDTGGDEITREMIKDGGDRVVGGLDMEAVQYGL